MSVFSKHVDLVTELFKQFFINLWVEILFDGNLKAFIHPFMNGAEPSLGDLWTNLQIAKINLQNRVSIELERLLPSGSILLYRHFVQLFLQLLYTFLLSLVLAFHLNNFTKCLCIVHCLFGVEPGGCLCLRIEKYFCLLFLAIL
jgi:hypothetical protein